MLPNRVDFAEYMQRKQFYRDQIARMKLEKCLSKNNVFSFKGHQHQETPVSPLSQSKRLVPFVSKGTSQMLKNVESGGRAENDGESICSDDEINRIANFRDSSGEKKSNRKYRSHSRDNSEVRNKSTGNKKRSKSPKPAHKENTSTENEPSNQPSIDQLPNGKLLNQASVISLIGNQLHMQKQQKWEIISNMHKLQQEKNIVINEMREREKKLIERIRELEIAHTEKDDEISLLKSHQSQKTELASQDKSTNYDSTEYLQAKVHNLEDKVDSQAQMIIKLKKTITDLEKEKKAMSEVIKDYITRKH